MKEQAILSTVMTKNANTATTSSLRALCSKFIYENRVICTLATLFSFILGEKVSTHMTYLLLNAAVALCAVIGFCGANLLVAMLCLIWLGAVVWQIRQEDEKRKI